MVLFRESYFSLRLILSIWGVIALYSGLVAVMAFLAQPIISFGVLDALIDMLLGAGFLYLAWKAKELVPRYHQKLVTGFWLLFAYSAAVGALSLLFADRAELELAGVGMQTAFMLTLASIGFAFLITGYITYSIKRLAREGDPAMRFEKSRQVLYWLVLALFLAGIGIAIWATFPAGA